MSKTINLDDLEVLPLTDLQGEHVFEEDLMGKVETAILEGQTNTLEIAGTPTGLAIFTTEDGVAKNVIHIGAAACLGIANVFFNRGKAFVVEQKQAEFDNELEKGRVPSN